VTTNQHSTTPDDSTDLRFNISLLAAVTTALERHGYVQPTEQAARNRSTADTMVALLKLTRAFEGEAS